MRIRNVKPEFYRSDDIDRLTWEQRYFFIALFSYVDDNGVGRDRLSDICADLLAGDFSVEPTETLGRVRQTLDVLEGNGLIVRYAVDGRRFMFITGWDRHQYVKNPNKERYPRPDKALLQSSGDSTETRGTSSGDAGATLPPVVGSSSRSLVVGSGSEEPAAANGRAAGIVSAWIDECKVRPVRKVIGQVRDQVQSLLDEDVPPERIRAGLDYWQQRGNLGPSLLPNIVHEVANRPAAESDDDPDAWMQPGYFAENAR